MRSSTGDREALRLEQSVGAFVERIRSVPPDRLSKPPAPGEWTVMELAAHSAEIYGYWAKQLVYLRAHPGQAFGRTAADPDRIRFVETRKVDALDTLVEQIQQGAREAAAALRAFSEDEWGTTTGLHSARGEMDMDFIAQLFVAGHAEEHLKQLEETLVKVRE